MFQEPRIAPVQPENLRENDPVFRARDETGLQRVKEIEARGEPCGFDRTDGIDDPAGANRQPGPTQRTREMRDVLSQPPVFGKGKIGKTRHGQNRNPTRSQAADRRRSNITRSTTDRAQVRVFKASAVLKPITYGAVSGDMQDPLDRDHLKGGAPNEHAKHYRSDI